MSRGQKTIGVVVPTINCADDLGRCLRSVQWVDEIIVTDMGSIDETVTVAKRFGAKVYFRIPRKGNFDLNRKFGMERARSDWILKLDSDELLSVPLQREISNFLQHDNGQYNGFNLYNRIFMFDHQVKHGFVKSRSHELRLVRRGKWHYDPYRFHQQITVDGKVGYLKNKYDHYNIKTVSDFIKKMNCYTDVDSKYYAQKISLVTVLLASPKTFFKLYFWQLGFLDGGLGFVVCLLFAVYNLVEKVKVWEVQNS